MTGKSSGFQCTAHEVRVLASHATRGLTNTVGLAIGALSLRVLADICRFDGLNTSIADMVIGGLAT
jgi:hypothetical protein